MSHQPRRNETSSKSDRPPTAGATRIDAALFDMDGVLTQTAEAHATAWKHLFDEFLRERAERLHEPFQPFDADADYRRHVDGKPRYAGVRDFLASRGIDLPWGTPDDGPDAMSVHGLGNRKDRYFHAWLDHNRVRTYPSTVSLIERLRESGVKTAIFTSSRNCRAVIENAGVHDLFDARVDGNDLASLGIPGKPDPAMLLEAARRLDVPPGRSAVFEDALAGVEAGARGGFRQVIGVNRGDYGPALAAKGANIVVEDLGALTFTRERGFSRAQRPERRRRYYLRRR